MQFLARGNDVLLLTDKNEVINLEKAVNLNAMAFFHLPITNHIITKGKVLIERFKDFQKCRVWANTNSDH